MRGKPQAEEDERLLRVRKKTATTVIRVVLGVVFVFSALVKLNDPLGLTFKIEEYLSAFGLGIELPHFLVVDAAGTLITLELILGAVLLMGRFKVFALWTLLALNGVFTAVTFFSAVTGAVPDCGCFGDAIHLSPWASFAKNIVILALVVQLIVWQRFIKPALGFRTSMSIVTLLFAFSIGIIYYVLRYEPLVDLRPYAVGTDIPRAMELPQGEDAPIFENVWTYRVDGREKRFSDQQEPWNMPGAEFVSRDTRLVSGKLPSITGFSATDRDGIDRTDSLLALEHVYLVTCFDMEASHPEGWEAVLRYLAHQDTPVVVLANTDQGEAVERLAIPFPIYFTDPVTLKTILRSNPGVVELKRGVVVSKRSCFELKNED